ncbi:hypothetical protein ArV1_005 [Arthrobacter phage vB_ArtM-ArV1]|uniref:Uncharacterized protein n=1 Tax=Arthrobacter phage vB_ArtM-ArV1 TaxID=1566993 RepID=A0A0A7HAU0_9CAUD|nr:hypothetical protein ArV1_005 [Arthrobacter phage vB_ArtM-ArV1]AIZ01693.1 hypothetical protein ArV1_005 [Arthrobacter phage vB_ArtM-ArV1]
MPIKRDSRGRFAGSGGGSRGGSKRASRVPKARQTAGKLQKSGMQSIADSGGKLTPKAKTQLKQSANISKNVTRKADAKRLDHPKREVAGGEGKRNGKPVNGAANLARKGVDHILARKAADEKKKKPTKKQQREAAMKKAQAKMLAQANAKNKR